VRPKHAKSNQQAQSFTAFAKWEWVVIFLKIEERKEDPRDLAFCAALTPRRARCAPYGLPAAARRSERFGRWRGVCSK